MARNCGPCCELVLLCGLCVVLKVPNESALVLLHQVLVLPHQTSVNDWVSLVLVWIGSVLLERVPSPWVDKSSVWIDWFGPWAERPTSGVNRSSPWVDWSGHWFCPWVDRFGSWVDMSGPFCVFCPCLVSVLFIGPFGTFYSSIPT